MANFDVFQMMTRRWALGDNSELHNVRVIDIVAGPGLYETLTVEREGATRPVVGGGRWNAEYSPRCIGKVGYLVGVTRTGLDADMPAGACYFREYPDQSLRRVPEFDDLNPPRDPHGRIVATIGWRCDLQPDGFRAPPGLIPGATGNFVADRTEAVTVRVPPEFARECLAVQRSVEAVLQGFMADAAGIMNYVARPRADGYSSHGSDERMYAENWLDRAYGMDRVDLDVVDAAEEEQAERQSQRDEFAEYLDDFLEAGGNADELIAAVAALVEQRRAGE